MSIDPNKIVTQDELDEPAPIDQVEARVQAQMKEIEGRARESVAQGMGDSEREREGRELKEEGKNELEQENEEQRAKEQETKEQETR